MVRVLWTFNLDFGSYMLAGVIWMLGWCMVLMAAAVFLPTAAVAVTSIVIIAGHNLTDLIPAQMQTLAGDGGSALLTLLYTGGGLQLGPDGPPLFVLYSIIPWIGVMMAGYAWGAVMQRPREERRRAALRWVNYRKGQPDDASFTRVLLDRGANPNARASLRQGLEEGHGGGPVREFRDLTPLGWGERFPEKVFVSRESLRLIEARAGRR